MRTPFAVSAFFRVCEFVRFWLCGFNAFGCAVETMIVGALYITDQLSELNIVYFNDIKQLYTRLNRWSANISILYI